MLAMAGQTAGKNGLIFFREPMGNRGVTKAKKIQYFFLIIFSSSKTDILRIQFFSRLVLVVPNPFSYV